MFDDVINRDVPIGKRSSLLLQQRLDTLDTAIQTEGGDVIDLAGRIQLVEDLEFLLIDDLVVKSIERVCLVVHRSFSSRTVVIKAIGLGTIRIAPGCKLPGDEIDAQRREENAEQLAVGERLVEKHDPQQCAANHKHPIDGDHFGRRTKRQRPK